MNRFTLNEGEKQQILGLYKNQEKFDNTLVPVMVTPDNNYFILFDNIFETKNYTKIGNTEAIQKSIDRIDNFFNKLFFVFNPSYRFLFFFSCFFFIEYGIQQILAKFD